MSSQEVGAGAADDTATFIFVLLVEAQELGREWRTDDYDDPLIGLNAHCR